MGEYSLSDYSEYVGQFNQLWAHLSTHCQNGGNEVAEMRGYSKEMATYLADEVGILKGETDWSVVRRLSRWEDFGLFTPGGSALMHGRYLIPIRDANGDVVSIVSWYPTPVHKKYITANSKYFRRSALFFGMEQLPETLNGGLVVVEGIFDTLSLKALGVPAVGMMGLQSSNYKTEILRAHNRIIAIPDNDSNGKTIRDNDEWSIGINGSYLSWQLGGNVPEGVKVKDMDDFVKIFGASATIDMLGRAVRQKGVKYVKESIVIN